MARLEGDIAAERAVLAGICKYGQSALVDIEDIVTIDSFTKSENKIILSCLLAALDNSTVVDEVSLLAAASQIGVYEQINEKQELEFIRSLFTFPIKQENVRQLGIKLRKLQLARELQVELENAHRKLSNIKGNESFSEIISIPESTIFDFANDITKSSEDRPQKLFEQAEEYIQHLIENRVEMLGLNTGFPVYDTVIGGGQRSGSVNLVVARPKTGKTTFAKTVAIHVARENRIPVLMLDSEMNRNDQINRSLASETKTKIHAIETGKFGDNEQDVNKILSVVKDIKDIPYYYKNIAGKPFDEVLSIMRRWVMQEVGTDDDGKALPCLVIYDYFKLMDSGDLDKMQEYQAMGFQISKMTDFANIYGPSVLAFVQANRDGINKESTDIISQSDRLLWLCGSCCLFRRKTQEEMSNEGLQNGTHKLVPLECRYGPGLDGDWINFHMDGNYASLKELTTYSQSQIGTDESYDIVDAEDEPPWND